MYSKNWQKVSVTEQEWGGREHEIRLASDTSHEHHNYYRSFYLENKTESGMVNWGSGWGHHNWYALELGKLW